MQNKIVSLLPQSFKEHPVLSLPEYCDTAAHSAFLHGNHTSQDEYTNNQSIFGMMDNYTMFGYNDSQQENHKV